MLVKCHSKLELLVQMYNIQYLFDSCMRLWFQLHGRLKQIHHHVDDCFHKTFLVHVLCNQDQIEQLPRRRVRCPSLRYLKIDTSSQLLRLACDTQGIPPNRLHTALRKRNMLQHVRICKTERPLLRNSILGTVLLVDLPPPNM